MRRHVSAEVLARYQEGDLGARRAASVAAHLSGCERCARTGSDLSAVSGLLAGVQPPVMPAALAERLALAISAESTARATQAARQARHAGKSAGTAPREDIPGRPDLPERSKRRRWSLPWLEWPGLASPVVLRGAAAVTLVVLLVGGGFLLARGGTGPQSSGSNTAGVPAAGGSGQHQAASRPEAAGLNGATLLHYRLNGKVVTATGVAGHVNFTRIGLADQVRRAVASHVSLGPAGVSAHNSLGPRRGTTTFGPLLGGVKVGALDGCLSRVSAGRRVVLAEIARYLGRPATIIVLKSLTANILDVAVVGLACSASAPDYILRTTVPAG